MQSRLKISIFTLVGLFIVLGSCKQNKKICAAYNSYFVYDEITIGKYFTPFGNDSIPGTKKLGRFNNNGALTQSGQRNDNSLLKYSQEEIKKAGKGEDSTLLANSDDSTGAIISEKELMPERFNTDQAAYDHYVGELLKEYQKKKSPVETGPPDSTGYFNNPPPEQTKEEKKDWKKQKKAYKKRKKKQKKQAKIDAYNEENGIEEEEEDEDFDFDLDE